MEAIVFALVLLLYLYPPFWACQRAFGAFLRRSAPFQFGLAELLLISFFIPLATMAFLYLGQPVLVAGVLVYQVAFALYFWTRGKPGETSTVMLLLAGILVGTLAFVVWFGTLMVVVGLAGTMFRVRDNIRSK